MSYGIIKKPKLSTVHHLLRHSTDDPLRTTNQSAASYCKAQATYANNLKHRLVLPTVVTLLVTLHRDPPPSSHLSHQMENRLLSSTMVRFRPCEVFSFPISITWILSLNPNIKHFFSTPHPPKNVTGPVPSSSGSHVQVEPQLQRNRVQ